MNCLFIKIHGIVQGVSYRYAAQRKAQKLGISGWIRNSADGTVEMRACGERQSLELFCEWCKTGPRNAQVVSLERKWITCENTMQNNFIIKY